jgi:hypothetical protein
VVYKGIKVPVIMQQGIPVRDAVCGDDSVDCLANCDAEAAQGPEVLRRLKRNFLPAQLNDC